jgi:hypothetical protein
MHVGMKKSPSAENGLESIFRRRIEETNHYAAKQDFAIIKISDMGYNAYAYLLRICLLQPSVRSAPAQAVRKASGGSYTISRSPARLPCSPCLAMRPGKTTWRRSARHLSGLPCYPSVSCSHYDVNEYT